ncbi:MAG: hypothetical protein P4L84_04565 [Isosphaeraceae bacterium]|nr:hypothetical protein [Isosphaeraceae bacterium]
MSRRIPSWIGVLCLAAGLAGCNYESPTPPPPPTGSYNSGIAPAPVGRQGRAPVPEPTVVNAGQKNKIILDSVITLMDNAVIKPGGQNFELATLNLNQYFVNPDPADYALSDAVRKFLLEGLPDQMVQIKRQPRDEVVKDFSRARFEMVDARHLEDCMLYSRIARRVAGSGDDLTRVNRLFDWTVRQVQLVPPGAFTASVGFQAQARPFDVLMRGMATEDGRGWAERAWVFLSLCRQLDLDCGLLSYTPSGPAKDAQESKEANVSKNEKAPQEPEPRGPVPWVCAVLIEGKPYLFDARIGLPIAGPDGKGVGTLQEALDDPRVLDRLELPGQSQYGTSRAQLLASPSKIGVLLDSTPGYFSPRMRLLQQELSGKDRTVLYRDPIDEGRKFAEAIGPRFGSTGLWELPVMVNTLLFSSSQFNEAARQALALFDPKYPLVYARVRQLRGDTSDAISRYVDMRFAERPMLVDKKTRMDPDIQRAMDVYSTYFLGLSHLEQSNPEQAEFFFRETLKLLPEPGPGRFYYNMFRWGAQTNLGRLLEERGDAVMAATYYAQANPTPQHHGDLLKARALVWLNPTAPLPPPLPPAPAPPSKNILLRDPAP